MSRLIGLAVNQRACADYSDLLCRSLGRCCDGQANTEEATGEIAHVHLFGLGGHNTSVRHNRTARLGRNSRSANKVEARHGSSHAVALCESSVVGCFEFNPFVNGLPNMASWGFM